MGVYLGENLLTGGGSGGGGSALIPTNQIILDTEGDNIGANGLAVPSEIKTKITDNGSCRVRSVLVGGGVANYPGAVVNKVRDLTILDYDPITLIQTIAAPGGVTTMTVDPLPSGGVVGGMFEHNGQVHTITAGAAGATQITFTPALTASRMTTEPFLNVHIDSASPTISYRVAPANSSLSNTITGYTKLSSSGSSSTSTGYVVRDGDCGNGHPNYSTYLFNVASDAYVNSTGFPSISSISWQPASGTTKNGAAASGYDSNISGSISSSYVYPLNIGNAPAGQTTSFSQGSTNSPTYSGNTLTVSRNGLYPWDGVLKYKYAVTGSIPDAGPSTAIGVVAAVGGTPQIFIRRSVGRSNFYDGTTFQFSNVRLTSYTYMTTSFTWRTWTANSRTDVYADNAISSDGTTALTSWEPSSGYGGYMNLTTSYAVSYQVGGSAQERSQADLLKQFPAGKSLSDWGQRGEIAIYY